jgi:hypothetical protein
MAHIPMNGLALDQAANVLVFDFMLTRASEFSDDWTLPPLIGPGGMQRIEVIE